MGGVQRTDTKTRNRIDRVCVFAMGKPMTVRLDSSTLMRGTVVEVIPMVWRIRGTSRVAQFKVTLECGVKKTRHSYIVERLPQSMNNTLVANSVTLVEEEE